MRTPSLHSIFHHSISNIIICYLCTMFATTISLRPTTLEDVLTTYTNLRHPTPMQQIVIFNSTGEVYVGARNTLYHLSSDLVPIGSVSTGPFLDNPQCLHPDYPCPENRTVMDNDCKILKIFYTSAYPMVLYCGTLYHGICSIHKFNETMRRTYVKPFNDTVGFVAGKGSTVGIFAESAKEKYAFFLIATSYDGRPLQYSPASVSSRRMVVQGKDVHMSYSYQSDTQFSGVNFALKKEYKVEYIHGFQAGDFAYFLTTQRVSVESEVIETRLARVCITDPNFFSYTEVPLKCNYGLEVYNLATAAGIDLASVQMKRRLKLDIREIHVLYVSFVRTVPDHGRLPDKTRGSVICSFPMTTIVEAFTNATKDCFKAELRTSLLKHVTGMDLSCTKRDDVEIGYNFCGSAFNQYIAGKESIPGGFRTHLDAYVSSVAFTLQKGKSIAVAGTDKGDVIKIDMDKREQQVLFTKNIAADEEDKMIQKSNSFDSGKENLYLLVGNKVVKFPIGSCSVYTDCSSCLTTDDPLSCGWCGDHCAHYDECETPDTFTKQFCVPVIYDVKPLNGPAEGGTLITVVGDNFGASQGGENHSKLSIKVADVPCEIFSWKKEEVKCKTKAIKDLFLDGPIEISVSDLSWNAGEFDMNGTALSQEIFTYLTPVLYGIYPGKGPMSGGTNITLRGKDLDIGYTQNIKIAGIPCSNVTITNNTALCVTEPLSKESSIEREVFPKTGPVELHIDDAIIEVENKIPAELVFEYPLSKNFKYLLDPEIYRIHPQVTTISGTNNLTITGRYLDSVETPRMIINVASSLIGKSLQIVSDPCWFNESSLSTSNGNSMICPTPQLKSSAFHAPTERAPLVTHVAFLMDGVQKLKQLPIYERKLSQLLYYPDPEYQSFGTSALEVSYEQTHLEIKGKYLNLAHEISVINVLFDNDTVCVIETLSSESLSCVIPNSDALHKNISEHFVMVHVGSLMFPLGRVKFVNDGLSVVSIVTSFLFACLILGGIILLFLYVQRCWKARAQRKQSDYRVTVYRIPSFNSVNSSENECAGVARQGSNGNDLPENGQNSTAVAATSAESCQAAQVVDDETMHLLQSENILVPRNNLSVCEIIGEDLPEIRQNSTAVAATSAESCQAAQVDDDETVHLLQSENILVPRNYLSVGEIIGKGHFGCVYKAELQLPNKGDKLEVAVKTLHNSWSTFAQETEAFLQEGLMMKDFHHHNVLTLIGICFEANGSPMVIIPFMKYGNLLHYMRENRVLTLGDLMTFAVQIAAGMKYLAGIKFVHRDLAARNCMLNDDKTVKVADFGLSRDIYAQDYYSSNNKKAMLPIKWMAPESIEKGSYTTKSDVWSYGVVLWELLTRGVTPYPGVDNWDILEYIKLGRRMPQPAYCSDVLYELMLTCWNEDPGKRPSFADLEEHVKSIITKLRRKNKQRTVELDDNDPQAVATASADQTELKEELT